MRKRQREQRNMKIAGLLNRASVELDLTRRDFEKDHLTDRGTLARVEAAFEPINEARRLLEGLEDEKEANGTTP